MHARACSRCYIYIYFVCVESPGGGGGIYRAAVRRARGRVSATVSEWLASRPPPSVSRLEACSSRFAIVALQMESVSRRRPSRCRASLATVPPRNRRFGRAIRVARILPPSCAQPSTAPRRRAVLASRIHRPIPYSCARRAGAGFESAPPLYLRSSAFVTRVRAAIYRLRGVFPDAGTNLTAVPAYGARIACRRTERVIAGRRYGARTCVRGKLPSRNSSGNGRCPPRRTALQELRRPHGDSCHTRIA